MSGGGPAARCGGRFCELRALRNAAPSVKNAISEPTMLRRSDEFWTNEYVRVPGIGPLSGSTLRQTAPILERIRGYSWRDFMGILLSRTRSRMQFCRLLNGVQSNRTSKRRRYFDLRAGRARRYFQRSPIFAGALAHSSEADSHASAGRLKLLEEAGWDPLAIVAHDKHDR